MDHLKITMPSTTTHVDIVVLPRDLHWAGLYHTCKNSRLLSVWHFDCTTILSYLSLKSGCRTYLTTHV